MRGRGEERRVNESSRKPNPDILRAVHLGITGASSCSHGVVPGGQHQHRRGGKFQGVGRGGEGIPDPLNQSSSVCSVKPSQIPADLTTPFPAMRGTEYYLRGEDRARTVTD